MMGHIERPSRKECIVLEDGINLFGDRDSKITKSDAEEDRITDAHALNREQIREGSCKQVGLF